MESILTAVLEGIDGDGDGRVSRDDVWALVLRLVAASVALAEILRTACDASLKALWAGIPTAVSSLADGNENGVPEAALLALETEGKLGHGLLMERLERAAATILGIKVTTSRDTSPAGTAASLAVTAEASTKGSSPELAAPVATAVVEDGTDLAERGDEDGAYDEARARAEEAALEQALFGDLPDLRVSLTTTSSLDQIAERYDPKAAALASHVQTLAMKRVEAKRSGKIIQGAWETSIWRQPEPLTESRGACEIQRVWRGKCLRRHRRRSARAAVRIQSIQRGLRDRACMTPSILFNPTHARTRHRPMAPSSSTCCSV